jgi:hypothetical protein
MIRKVTSNSQLLNNFNITFRSLGDKLLIIADPVITLPAVPGPERKT